MNYKKKITLIILLIVFMLQAVFSMRQKSPTWDETILFGLGYYLLNVGRWDVPSSILHPPLPYYLNSIPFLFNDAEEKAFDKGEEFSNVSIPFAGLKLLTDSRYPQDHLLFRSRIPSILIALLLGFYIWKWACELYSSLSASIALFLFSFCPNILAHSGLITPDILLTCFTFISVYYLWKIIKDGTWNNILLCSLSFGCALLSKYTALLLFPIYFVLSIIFLISHEEIMLPHRFPFSTYLMKNGTKARILRVGSLFFVITTIAICVLSIGYMFHLKYYVKGIFYQFQHAQEKTHPGFLMGMYSSKGWWYYYLIAFAIKTPIPILILLLLSFVFYKKHPRSDFLKQAFLLVPVFVYFFFFSVMPICIGLRYILPVFPFLFVQAGMVAGIQFKRMRVVAYVFIAVLCFWHMTSSIGVYPHYLAYFNEAVGGPDKGYNYLVDSNLDWGQDLKGLGIYMKKKGIQKVHLSYFGTADPRYYGINYEWMPSFYLPEDHYDGDNRRRDFTFPDSGIVAISATNLQNVFFGDKTYYNWLKKYNPIDKIGYSIFIYDLDQQKESHR
jgi:4-amino-4-deoxy-L-arabinose transferase-like glycosyltransferase